MIQPQFYLHNTFLTSCTNPPYQPNHILLSRDVPIPKFLLKLILIYFAVSMPIPLHYKFLIIYILVMLVDSEGYLATDFK